MPAEAHRLQQPIGVRDRRLLWAFAALSALAVLIALAVSVPHRGSHARPRPGCISAPVAGVMGGGTVKGCGARAAALCRTYAATFDAVAVQCAALPRRSGRGEAPPSP
jgi:hypothetical protein